MQQSQVRRHCTGTTAHSSCGSSSLIPIRVSHPENRVRCAVASTPVLSPRLTTGSGYKAPTLSSMDTATSLSLLPDFRMSKNLEPISPELRKSTILYFSPENAELARAIAEAANGSIELGSIQWRKFADGFPDLFVDDAIRIRNKHVAFLASFHNPSVIFEQISVIYALPRLFVGSFTLVLPFFPTGTLERVETEGDVATAFTLARILTNVPPSRGGPTSLVVFDIHALQERFYFGDTVMPLFESGVPLLLEKLRSLPDQENITIAYPDEGAWKRFHFQFKNEGYQEIICTKVRDGSKRIVRLKEGEPKGKHVVIVDDLVQSGGTLLECHAVLAAHGAKHVSAYVTHGVFPNMTWLKFKADHGSGASTGFRYFWLTDSCPQTVSQVKGKAPFEVLSLAGPIAAALQI